MAFGCRIYQLPNGLHICQLSRICANAPMLTRTIQRPSNMAGTGIAYFLIARKISFGTRTKQGSRAFTILASVIETCRQRGAFPSAYLAQVIAQRRQGHSAPPLPEANC